MSENILCVKNIKKSFGGVHALKGVDLTIKKGETHCLAGENGCGKSTIIKVISGFYKPDEGTIEILVFVVNGGIAAIAGLCYAMMSYFYLPNEYAGAEMLVIAAVILGGTRMTGGIGTLRGCLLGTLLLTMVANSLILLGISVYWEKVFIGAIIIIGTAISAMQAKSASKTTAKKKGVE